MSSKTSQTEVPGYCQSSGLLQSECFKTFRPIFVVLFLCGIDIVGSERFRHIRLIYTISVRLALVLAQIVCSYYIVLIVALQIRSVSLASFHITALLIVLQVFAANFIVTLRRKKIKGFFVDFCKTCSDIMGNEPKVYRSSKILTKGTVVLVVLVFFLFAWAAYSHSIQHEAPDQPNNNTNFRLVVVPCYYPLYIMVVFSTCFHVVFVLWYLNVCFILIKSFQRLEKTDVDGTSAETLALHLASTLLTKKVVKFHRKLCLMVQTMDDIFREIVGIWHFSEIVSAIFIIRAMDLHKPNTARAFDHNQIAIIVVCLVIFVLQAVSASYINCLVGANQRCGVMDVQ